MEDLASMITQFLGSEEGMNQLRAVTEALGLDSPGTGNGGTPPAASRGGRRAAGGNGRACRASPPPQISLSQVLEF